MGNATPAREAHIYEGIREHYATFSPLAMRDIVKEEGISSERPHRIGTSRKTVSEDPLGRGTICARVR